MIYHYAKDFRYFSYTPQKEILSVGPEKYLVKTGVFPKPVLR